MEFKRIDDDTIRCIITEEDMLNYNVELEDFLKNQGNVQEFLHAIIEQAEEEVDFKPLNGMLSMQVMPLPENRFSLTFSEGKNQTGNIFLDQIRNMISGFSNSASKAAMDKLNDMSEEEKAQSFDKFMKGIIDDAADEFIEQQYQGNKDKTNQRKTSIQDQKSKDTKEKTIVEKQPSFLRIYQFDCLQDVEAFCGIVPEKVNPKSRLYKDETNGKFYLLFEKGRMSKVNFTSICNNASEFGVLVSDNKIRVAYLEEHCNCMIKASAIKILRNLVL